MVRVTPTLTLTLTLMQARSCCSRRKAATMAQQTQKAMQRQTQKSRGRVMMVAA
jgi:hypothetical protein